MTATASAPEAEWFVGRPLAMERLEWIITSDGTAHGDLFCEDARALLAVAAPEYVELPADAEPDAPCPLCAHVVQHPFAGPGLVALGNGPSMDAPEGGGGGEGTGTRPSNRATDKQVAFIEALLERAGEPSSAYFTGEARTLSKRQASEVIDDLKVAAAKAAKATDVDEAAVRTFLNDLGRPVTPDDLTPELTAYAMRFAAGYDGNFAFMVDMRKAARSGFLSPGQAKGVLNCVRADIAREVEAEQRAELPEVPAGRWAYVNDADEVTLVRIDRPTEGRWAGYVFGHYLTGGGEGGTLTEAGRVPYKALGTVLGKIAALGLAESAALFGRTAKACAKCGRGLVDQGNPYYEMGYGPTCGAEVVG